jgi:hypothetical protein
MPRIPIYEQQIAPNASPGVARISTGGVGQGLETFGRSLERVAGSLERREQMQFQLDMERVETEGRVWFANAASRADLDMAEFLQKKQQEAGAGAPGFTPDFLKGYDEYAEGALKNAPSNFARNLLQAHMAQSREAYGKGALTWEAGERTRYTGEQIDDGVAMSAKIVNGNPAWFDREMGKWASTIKGAAIDEAAKSKLRDMARAQLVNAAVVSWIDRDPAKASAVLQDIAKTGAADGDVQWSDGSGTYNVPVKLGTLAERMKWTEYAERKVNEMRQDMGVTLRYEIQNAEAMARTGVAPTGPARTRADFSVAFKDPQVADYEFARYTTARQTASAVSSLQGQSSADLLAIMQRKPNASDPNFAVTAANQEIQSRAAAEIVQARQADPVAYALQTGDFKLQVLNPQDQAAFSEELKRRTAALPGMAGKYGTASVLSKQEASVMAQQLELLPADRKVEQLETIRRSVGDDAVYGSVLNAIRPDSPVTALVGNIAVAGSKDAARLIAMGEDLLNPTKGGRKTDGAGSKFPMPQEALIRQAWVDGVGDAYRGYPDAEATGYQAFKAYYAAVASQKGLNDPKAAPDDQIVRDALNASTGGVMRWKTDWFGNDTPAANIVLPYGMPEDSFRDRVSAEWLRIRGGLGYSKTDVGDIGLYNTGANGEYMVMSGSSWLPDKNGRPVVLRITDAMPTAAPTKPAPKITDLPASGPPSIYAPPEVWAEYRKRQAEKKGD